MRRGRACLKGWVEPKGAKREDRGYSGTALDGVLGLIVAVVHEQRQRRRRERGTLYRPSSLRTRVALQVIKSVHDAADKIQRQICPGPTRKHGGASILSRLGNFLMKN